MRLVGIMAGADGTSTPATTPSATAPSIIVPDTQSPGVSTDGSLTTSGSSGPAADGTRSQARGLSYGRASASPSSFGTNLDFETVAPSTTSSAATTAASPVSGTGSLTPDAKLVIPSNDQGGVVAAGRAGAAPAGQGARNVSSAMATGDAGVAGVDRIGMASSQLQEVQVREATCGSVGG